SFARVLSAAVLDICPNRAEPVPRSPHSAFRKYQSDSMFNASGLNPTRSGRHRKSAGEGASALLTDFGPDGFVDALLDVDWLVRKLQEAEGFLAGQECVYIDSKRSLLSRVESMYVVACLRQPGGSAGRQQHIASLSNKKRILGRIL